jgi:hypothetical protein
VGSNPTPSASFRALPWRDLTPHEQRKRELGALRGLIADLEPHVGAATVPNSTVAGVFERHTSQLPADSALRGQLERLAARLRRDPADVVVGSHLRQIVVRFKQKADVIGPMVDGRDARLSERR